MGNDKKCEGRLGDRRHDRARLAARSSGSAGCSCKEGRSFLQLALRYESRQAAERTYMPLVVFSTAFGLTYAEGF